MINSQNLQDWRKKIGAAIDNRVRIITAGLGLDELRAVMRGDPPTEKPNPRYKVHTTSFIFHIRPRYYQLGSTILTHTFRLGFFTTLFFIIEAITGTLLMIYYTPSPEKAYISILNLLSNVPFGQFLRDMHRLGAEAMVIFTVLHMLRTFFTGSYKKERSFTWLTGIILLGVTLFLSFSGYLLPWDQLAYWAVTIGTSMAEAAPIGGNEVNLLLRGAPDIGANGLLRFYLLHVVALPFAVIAVLSIHYYKVSREHGISLPARFEEGEASPEQVKEAKRRIDFIPDLFTGEIFWTTLGLLLVVLAIAVFGYSAGLESVANPQKTPLDTTAPWYFLWLQGLLKLGDKSLMGIVIPTIIVLLLIAVPYIDRNPHRSMWRRPWAVGIGMISVIALIVLSYMGLPRFGIETDPATRIVQDMAPEEGVGPLREVPFEQLQPGVYTVNETSTRNMCPQLDFGCPEFEAFFTEFSDRINEAVEEGKLSESQATLSVENWQQDLKKTTFQITWIENGESQSYEHPVYIHADRIGE